MAIAGPRRGQERGARVVQHREEARRRLWWHKHHVDEDTSLKDTDDLRR